jgi:hypothetical protein
LQGVARRGRSPEGAAALTLAEGETCPGCGADLRGGLIPDDPKQRRYSRVIGVEYAYDDPGHYDGVSEWRCPDCGRREGRWSGRPLQGDDFERPFGRSR